MKQKIALLLVTFVFSSLVTSIPFIKSTGGKPSRSDRKDYARRAVNFDGKKFHNEPEVQFLIKVEDEDPLRISKNREKPDHEIPVKTPQIKENPDAGYTGFTWFGHSSFLIQVNGKNILVDPVFSERISPVSWAGPKRFTKPTVTIGDLPKIDLLILTHDHYDHLDYKSLLELDGKVCEYIVPLGVECHLKKWKINPDKIRNAAWWEEILSDGITVAATPAQHFSGRWIWGRNRTLWNSYVIKTKDIQIFLSGDSGYGEHFKKIHEKYGDFDLAVMECGQYNSRWPSIHSFPEQTVQASIDVGARLTVPVHWGAIVLSSNGWDDSILRFLKAADEKNLEYMTPGLCETADILRPYDYRYQWWIEQ